METRESSGRAHRRAVLSALLVTFLWSTSWVLIKLGLKAGLPAVTFAGLRYCLAFLCLAPFVLANPAYRDAVRSLPRSMWLQLILLGFVYYTLTQGTQFIGLTYLPAATLTLILSFSPIAVALMSLQARRERPSAAQWSGSLLSALGAVVYFTPLDVPSGQAIGLGVAVVGLLANAGASILGRQVNSRSGLSPVVVTTLSMGVGGVLLLAIGALTQGFGHLDLRQWLIVAWLAVVNTAIAFTLWNYSLRSLTAVQSSVINNLMLPQIAILAWVALGESLGVKAIAGMTLVVAGVLIVQVSRARR